MALRFRLLSVLVMLSLSTACSGPPPSGAEPPLAAQQGSQTIGGGSVPSPLPAAATPTVGSTSAAPAPLAATATFPADSASAGPALLPATATPPTGTPTLTPLSSVAPNAPAAPSRILVANEGISDFQLIPNSDMIIYTQEANPAWRRFVLLSLDGSVRRELDMVDDVLHGYTVSDDGRWLLAYNVRGLVVAIPLDGGPHRRLVEPSADDQTIICATFSPDGRWFVYGRGFGIRPTPQPDDPPGTNVRAIYAVSAEQGPIELRTSGSGPNRDCQLAVSPGSDRVLSVVGEYTDGVNSGGELQLASLPGATLANLGQASWAAFSADGSRVWFLRPATGDKPATLYSAPAGGGAPSPTDLASDGAWQSPVGVALEAFDGASLYSVPIGGGVLVTLSTRVPSLWFVPLTLTPDSRWAIFPAWEAAGTEDWQRDERVFAASLTGGAILRLNASGSRVVKLTPDGRRVVVLDGEVDALASLSIAELTP